MPFSPTCYAHVNKGKINKKKRKKTQKKKETKHQFKKREKERIEPNQNSVYKSF